MSMLLFRPSRPQKSVGVAIASLGFGFMALGSKYIVSAFRAGSSAAKTVEDAPPPIDMTVKPQYYEGGFEDKMTKREAALILGCREAASKEQIMERYRVLIRLNHPDMGGSPTLAGKVNEAKIMLHQDAHSDPNHVSEAERKKGGTEKKRRRRTDEDS
jgi:hypothetical protein